ncbi:hypothetical protein ElyMa_006262400 [Elysia marginata]|uniref:Uncharacterized protein n=1 Tax=Elysia marginata TaxID=1093978 RepID=A0AAV4HB80_9GAST|nr:hypothetical protein ElyMa_006262400 [Elysia marginata]
MTKLAEGTNLVKTARTNDVLHEELASGKSKWVISPDRLLTVALLVERSVWRFAVLPSDQPQIGQSRRNKKVPRLDPVVVVVVPVVVVVVVVVVVEVVVAT